MHDQFPIRVDGHLCKKAMGVIRLFMLITHQLHLIQLGLI